MKTLQLIGEGSSRHAVVPFVNNDSETSLTLQRLLTDAWLRPYTRPRWLKVGPRRAQIRDEVVRVVPTFLLGDMVAMWRLMKGGGIPRKLLDCRPC